MKDKLLQEIQIIEIEIERLKKATRPIAPEVSLGRLTRLEAIANKGVNESILIENQNKLKKLKDALAKIDSNDYGLCEKCLQPISKERLEFLPESTLCIQCA